MTEESEVGDVEILEATADEKAQFEHYKKGLQPDENGQISIDIPFGFTVGAATVVGLFHLRDPIEKSSAEGAVAGVINGTFKLNRARKQALNYTIRPAACCAWWSNSTCRRAICGHGSTRANSSEAGARVAGSTCGSDG